MPLHPGTTLGHYQVTAKIGEGGMGEVYRARDTKLDRDVALKVLPEAFTSDPDRLARFEREAKVLASLNHPNIGHIYGLEDAEGTKALVLELVEGPTLADRIKDGPIPIDEALPIAKQIAEALEAAHEQGIIHRDLKPANVKVKADGTVKVLDFGLAKAFQPEASGASASESPTISLTAAATQMGMVIGTAAYMSPEQARGKPVDKRADIWAFGCVLYEMLTGRHAFRGEDLSVTLANVINSGVEWAALPHDVPVAVSAYLRGCLQKDPARRVRDIGDMKLAMEGAFDLDEPRLDEVGPRSGRIGVVALVGVGLAASLLTGFATRYVVMRDLTPVSRLIVSTGLTAPPSQLDVGGVALSPDGRTLAYVGVNSAGTRELYVRPLSRFDAIPIPGSVGASAPFFSPDGDHVAFAAAGELKRVVLAGGRPTTVCSIPGSFRGGSWGANGAIVFGVAESGLWRVPAQGGEAESLTSFEGDEVLHAEPDLQADMGLLFFTASGQAGNRLAVVDLDTGQRTSLGEGSSPRMTSDGRLLYLHEGAVWTAPFDIEDVRLSEAGVPVVDDIGRFAVAKNADTLAYVPAAEDSRLVWVDRTGEVAPAGFEPGAYSHPRISPNGDEVAVEDMGRGIWVLDLERGSRTLLVDDTNAFYPIWTSDGLNVTFALAGPDLGGLHRRVANGGGPVEVLREDDIVGGSWSSDGSLAYWAYPPTVTLTGSRGRGGGVGNRDIGVMSADGDLSPLIATAFSERSPRVSPDGRWLAYLSDESGRDEVYLQAYPGGGRRTAISINGGREPVWSRDGRELFFWTLDEGALMVVRVGQEPGLTVTAPERLFVGAYQRNEPGIGIANYDVAEDGYQPK